MRDWLVGNMGTAGEYAYEGIHFATVAVVLLALILAVLIGKSKKLDNRMKTRVLRAVCWFQLGFELLWRLIYVTVKGDSLLCWWPLYPCNLGGILLPIIALVNWKRGKDLFYLFGFIGGVLTFAIPDGIFVRDVLVFPILKSILQHTGILLIPALEVTAGRWRPSLQNLSWTILGCVIHLINCEGITRLLGFTGDYMFFRSSLPFVIHGVPQFITLTVFGTAVLAAICGVADLVAKKR